MRFALGCRSVCVLLLYIRTKRSAQSRLESRKVFRSLPKCGIATNILPDERLAHAPATHRLSALESGIVNKGEDRVFENSLIGQRSERSCRTDGAGRETWPLGPRLGS